MAAAPIDKLVPKAAFIDDVASFVKGRVVDEVMAEIQENLQRYKYVEQELTERKARLMIKQPEIGKCLDAVNLLIQQREAGGEKTVVDFALSDQVYARASLQNVDSVGLWLGAGVMVEYDLDDAKNLLEKQLAGCIIQLEAAEKDYDYVKDQLTTTEVSAARIYNYDVMRRKETSA